MRSLSCRRSRKLINTKLSSTSDFNNNEAKKSTVVVNYKGLILCISTGGRLGDEHINAANQLSWSQFPDIQGLCTPVLGQKLCFPKFITLKGYAGHSYLQILHTGEDHWITIEILSKEEVRVYNSIF